MELVKGVGDLARGFRFLSANPRLWGWVIAPAIITLLVIAAVIWGVLSVTDPAVTWVAERLPSWLQGWVGGLLRALVIVGLSVGGFLVFVTLAGLVAGPFCELLSEAVEERVTGVAGPGFSLSALVRGLVVGAIHAMRRLFLYLFTIALVFVLGSVIPLVGPALALALGAYFTATSAAYDCFDAVLGRRLWPYRDKIRFLRAHRARTFGLGAGVAGLLLVPVVNLAALGVGAVGATLAVLDLERRG
jgi:CysZ protein